MNLDKLLRPMGFTMNAYVNLEPLMYGDIVQRSLTILQFLLLLMIRYGVYMGEYPQKLLNWTKLEESIEKWKFLMKVQCVI